MDLFEKITHQEYGETLHLQIPVVIKNNKQAYACMCINELLHTFDVITDDNYATIYALIADSEIFTEF